MRRLLRAVVNPLGIPEDPARLTGTLRAAITHRAPIAHLVARAIDEHGIVTAAWPKRWGLGFDPPTKMRPADLLITRALAVLSDVDPHHGEQLAAAGMTGVGTLAQLCFDAAPFFVPGRVAWGLAHTDPGTTEIRLPARAVSMWFSEPMTVDVELAPGWLHDRTHSRAEGDRDAIPVGEPAETLAWRRLVQFPDRGHGDAAIFGAVLISDPDGAPCDAVVWIVGHRFTGGARDDGWAFGAIPGLPSLSGWRDWWWSMCAIAAWGDWVPDQPVVVRNNSKRRRMAADGFDPGRLGLIRVLDSRRKVHPDRAAGEGSHASPTEHLRRGHWRGQRVGPGRVEVETRWIAPTIVNPGFVLDDRPTVWRLPPPHPS